METVFLNLCGIFVKSIITQVFHMIADADGTGMMDRGDEFDGLLGYDGTVAA
jgi:hypothetical protein